MIGDPTVYITSVGLYNDAKELLAVGKLNKPLKKTFSLESLVKVRLDFVWIGFVFGIINFLN
jgi:hypothetical protein